MARNGAALRRGITERSIVSELIAALDIGTSKVVATVAELDAEQKINVIGFGEQPSLGLRKRHGGGH